jgi:hypothetical protein
MKSARIAIGLPSTLLKPWDLTDQHSGPQPARTRTNVQASDEAILRNALPKPGIDPGYLGDPPGDKSPIRGATFAMRRIQHEVYR